MSQVSIGAGQSRKRNKNTNVDPQKKRGDPVHGTEEKAAKKFDDLVFGYTKNGRKEYRLLQAKHRLNEDKKITSDDLLTESDGDYSLIKYFFSYQDSKNEKLFEDGSIKDVIVCTNIDLDLDHLKDKQIKIHKIDDVDNILDTKTVTKQPTRYRFSEEVISLLKPKLQDYNLTRLAKRLANCLLKNNPIQHHKQNDIFQFYHAALAEEVIDVGKGKGKIHKFHDRFIKGENLSVEGEMFRKAFVEEIKKQSEKKLTLENINAAITSKKIIIDDKRIGLNLSKNFGIRDGAGVCPTGGQCLSDGGTKTIKFPKLRQFFPRFFTLTGGHSIPDGGAQVPPDPPLAPPLFGIGTDKSWPNNAISDDEIKDYLSHLVFAVNQPNEEELGKIIKDEIGQEFNYIATEYVYDKFLKTMLDWLQGKEGERFLSNNDGKKLFEKAKQDLAKLELIALSLENRDKIEKLNIAFSEELTELKSFLTDRDKQIFNLIGTHDTVLSSVKVYHILQDICKYREDDGYILIHLDSLLGKRVQDLVIQAFDSEATNYLLVIECKARGEDIEGLYNQISQIIAIDVNKKVILITQENDPLANKFNSNFSDKYEEKKDKKNSLTDLVPESQKRFLEEGKVIFQGEEVSLGTLVDDETKNLIGPEVLSKLINKEKIVVGKELSGLDAVKDYYIDRVFIQIIEESCFKAGIPDLFVISNVAPNNLSEFVSDVESICKFEDSDLDMNKPIKFVILLAYGIPGANFMYPNHDIHWFNGEERGRSRLEKSDTLLDLLMNVTAYGSKPCTVYLRPGLGGSLMGFCYQMYLVASQFCIVNDKNNKIVCISADPGMGKSTVLTHLAEKAKQSYPSLWVVRVNLNDYTRNLAEINFNNDANKAIHFVLSIVNLKTSLEKELFKRSFHRKGKIALLFDGFDEISPDYKDKVIELLQILKSLEVEKLWFTTRPYGIQNELENKLSISSYVLKPFDEKDQKHFLRKFWKKELELDKINDERFEVFTDELIKRFTESISDWKKKFMSIPLHITMIADIFKDEFEKFHNSGSNEWKETLIEKLNLLNLYEKFIERKYFEIYCEDKNEKDLSKIGVLEEVKTQLYPKFIQDHTKLAMYSLFEEDKLSKFFSQAENVCMLKCDINAGKQKVGIIDKIVNDKPHFIHRTFGEYFVSIYFWEKFKSIEIDKFKEDFIESIIIENLINCEMIQICRFFQLKAGKDLENDIDFPSKKDKLNLLFTRLVDKTYKYTYRSTKLLLEIIKYLSIEQQSKLEIIVNVQNLENDKRLALLCVSAEMGCIKLADAVGELDTQFLKNCLEGDNWSNSPLWLAVKNGHLDVARILIKKLRYRTTWKDYHKYILLQRVLYINEFDVLRSCLKLDLIAHDISRAYCDSYGKNRSPLVDCLKHNAPSDVIELLIEKTDINFINQLEIDGIPAVAHIIRYLVPYPKNFIDSLKEKGMNLNIGYNSGVTPINIITCEFRNKSITAHKYLKGKPSLRHFFYSDKEFSEFFNLVESLLEYGAVYNVKDEDGHTALQYVKQTHYIHQLFKVVFNAPEMGNDTVSTLLDKISDKVLQLMIKNPSIKYSDYFLGYEILETALLPKYDGFKLFSDGKNHLRLPDDDILFVPEYIRSFLQSYKKGDTTEIKSTFDNFFHIIEEIREEIDILKCRGETVTGILAELKKKNITSDNLAVMDLLERAVELYIDQNYKIDEALSEVLQETVLSEKIQSYVKNLPKMAEHQGSVYKIDEILSILSIKDSNIEEDFMSKINESNGIDFLHKILLWLNNVGQKNKKEVLKSMFKFSEQSSRTFELLETVDNLLSAINNNNKENLISVLQNVSQSSFIETTLNAYIKQGQRQLDCASKPCDVQIVNLLRKHAKFSNNFDYLELFSGSQVQGCLNHCAMSQENVSEFNTKNEVPLFLFKIFCKTGEQWRKGFILH